MDTYELNKVCDVCKNKVPDSFMNLLCYECYDRQVKEIEMRKKDEEEAKLAVIDVLPQITLPVVPQEESKIEVATRTTPTIPARNNGITDPNYQENPEMEDKNQVAANIAQFNKTGLLLWHSTRMMYEFIKNYCITKSTSHVQYPKFIFKPQIVDIGSGCGVGSNVLSQEADFVWGIDKNENSVKFAQEAFTRVKNGIYYNAQVTFDRIDIMTDNREFQKFDICTIIEVIEHVSDHRTFLTNIIKKFDRRKTGYEATEYFISTPNRNNKRIQKDRPFNPYHTKEFTSEEFFVVLSEFFTNIKFYSAAGEPIEGITTTHTPLLAQCSGAKI